MRGLTLALLYKFPAPRGGDGLARKVAYLPGVQAVLLDTAEDKARSAALTLAAHRYTGKAHIEIEHFELDYYVTLVDPDGQAAAIEYGREGYWDPDTGQWHGASEGVGALTKAGGLRRKKKIRMKSRAKKKIRMRKRRPTSRRLTE